MCIYICIHIYIYIFIHSFTYIHIYIYMYVYITYMLTYMYVMYVRIPTHVRHDAIHSCEMSHFVSHMYSCSPHVMYCAFPATHCNTLQHADLYGDTPQHTTHCAGPAQYGRREHGHVALQYTATHCNSLQHTEHTATHYSLYRPCAARRAGTRTYLQHTAMHCNTLQHTTHCAGSAQHGVQ